MTGEDKEDTGAGTGATEAADKSTTIARGAEATSGTAASAVTAARRVAWEGSFDDLEEIDPNAEILPNDRWI